MRNILKPVKTYSFPGASGEETLAFFPELKQRGYVLVGYKNEVNMEEKTMKWEEGKKCLEGYILSLWTSNTQVQILQWISHLYQYK